MRSSLGRENAYHTQQDTENSTETFTDNHSSFRKRELPHVVTSSDPALPESQISKFALGSPALLTENTQHRARSLSVEHTRAAFEAVCYTPARTPVTPAVVPAPQSQSLHVAHNEAQNVGLGISGVQYGSFNLVPPASSASTSTAHGPGHYTDYTADKHSASRHALSPQQPASASGHHPQLSHSLAYTHPSSQQQHQQQQMHQYVTQQFQRGRSLAMSPLRQVITAPVSNSLPVQSHIAYDSYPGSVSSRPTHPATPQSQSLQQFAQTPPADSHSAFVVERYNYLQKDAHNLQGLLMRQTLSVEDRQLIVRRLNEIHSRMGAIASGSHSLYSDESRTLPQQSQFNLAWDHQPRTTTTPTAPPPNAFGREYRAQYAAHQDPSNIQQYPYRLAAYSGDTLHPLSHAHETFSDGRRGSVISGLPYQPIGTAQSPAVGGSRLYPATPRTTADLSSATASGDFFQPYASTQQASNDTALRDSGFHSHDDDQKDALMLSTYTHIDDECETEDKKSVAMDAEDVKGDNGQASNSKDTKKGGRKKTKMATSGQRGKGDLVTFGDTVRMGLQATVGMMLLTLRLAQDDSHSSHFIWQWLDPEVKAARRLVRLTSALNPVTGVVSVSATRVLPHEYSHARQGSGADPGVVVSCIFRAQLDLLKDEAGQDVIYWITLHDIFRIVESILDIANRKVHFDWRSKCRALKIIKGRSVAVDKARAEGSEHPLAIFTNQILAYPGTLSRHLVEQGHFLSHPCVRLEPRPREIVRNMKALPWLDLPSVLKDCLDLFVRARL